jgi:class 3 adenylate cyclase
MAGSEEEALRQARLAQGIGERLAIPAIQALALQQQGYALVAMGRVDDGLALIDESTVVSLLPFEDASAAIEAAVAVQRSLAEHRRSHGFAPQVRIGLHEAQASARAIDFVGRGVHEAARIGSLAGGGQILASVNTVQSAATRFPISTPRSVTLKGVSDPVDVVTIEWM